MQTIVFNSEKGGTGKTTLSTHTAALMAAYGGRVLLVDADPQAHATISLGIDKQPGLYNVLVRGEDLTAHIKTPDPERYSPPGVEPKGVLYVLPGNAETHAIATMLEDADALAEVLEDIEDAIDVVIIDTPPSPGLLLSLIYSAANYVVVPTQMEMLSLDGVAGTIAAANKRGVELLGIIPNQYRETTALHKYFLEQLSEIARENNWRMFPPIAQRIVWAEASTLQQMVYSLDGEAGKARVEATRLARDIMRVIGVAV